MTYETFLSIREKTSRIKLCDLIGLLNDLYREANLSEDAIDEYYKLFELIDVVFESTVFIGDNNDYHNIAVTCAKNEDYDVACRFLEYGLNHFPFDVDLLADYLKYGMKCDRVQECKKVFTNLLTRKSNWNWRAYKFSIDYLMDLTNIDSVDRKNEIIMLIKDFQKDLPEEDAYLAEAEFNQKFVTNEQSGSTFVSVLEHITSNDSIIKRTPKCDLKLADYYYNIGNNTQKALLLLECCKKNSVEIQRSVNRAYVYLLSSLCKMTQYYEMKKTADNEELENLANDIYLDYHVAAIDINDSRVRDCKHLIESFIRETSFPYPYDDLIENVI